MAEERLYGVNINLDQNELILARLHDIGGGLPNSPAPVTGQLAYDSTLGIATPHWYNGSAWRPFNYIAPGSLTDNLFSSTPADLLSFSKLKSPTTSFSFNNQRLTNLASPTSDTDAINRGFLLGREQLSSIKIPVRAATNVAIPNVFYSVGQGTLTSTISTSLNTLNSSTGIDGVNTLVIGDRLLLKNQVDAAQNGIYTITQLGSGSLQFVLTRSFDANTPDKFYTGITVYVKEGTANQKTYYSLSTLGTISVGVTPVTFSIISGIGSVQNLGGLTITGNSLGVNVSGSNTIGVISNSLRVKSSIGIGQVLLSTGNTSQEATWGPFNLAGIGNTSGLLPISKGGTNANTSFQGFLNLTGISNPSPGSLLIFNDDATQITTIPGRSNTLGKEVLSTFSGIYAWSNLSLLDIVIDTSMVANLGINPAVLALDGLTLLDWFIQTEGYIDVIKQNPFRLTDDTDPRLSETLITRGFEIRPGPGGSISNPEFIPALKLYTEQDSSVKIGRPTSYLSINVTDGSPNINSIILIPDPDDQDLSIEELTALSINALAFRLTTNDVIELVTTASINLIGSVNISDLTSTNQFRASGFADIEGELVARSNAFIEGDVSIKQALFVEGTTVLLDQLIVGGTLTATSGLEVDGPVRLNFFTFPDNPPTATQLISIDNQGLITYTTVNSDSLSVTYTPQIYTIAGTNITDHLVGIDLFLSNLGNFSGTSTDSVGSSTGSNVSYNQALPAVESGSAYEIAHNLNSTEVITAVYDIATNTRVYTGITITSSNTAVIEVDGGIPANTYRVVIVKPSIVRRYSQLVPNPTNATLIEIEHGFNTDAVVVYLYEATLPAKEVYAQVTIVNSNTISLSFDDPPAPNEYKVIVIG